jgi:4-diphosphocytidyl-2-C-methyl-D-erythritol kinase
MALPPPTPTDEATLRAPSKVNLFLRVGSRRADGYHDIETFFLPLPEPADTFLVRFFDEPGNLDFLCSEPELETEDNLVVRAYRSFGERTGFFPRLEVTLTKRIPHGAGLGGGSSDAATLLRYLNDHAGARTLTESDLAGLALRLGADVPFFLLARPARAGGVGERLKPDDPGLAGMFVVVVCSRQRVSTAWAYAALDASRSSPPKAGENCLTSVFLENRRTFCVTGQPLRNDFESVVFAAYPGLGRIKERLLACGAAGALLSGSGSAVFGLFRERAMATLAMAEFSGNDPSVFVTSL